MPTRKTAATKTSGTARKTARKTASKKTAARKTVVRKAATRKTAARKTAARAPLRSSSAPAAVLQSFGFVEGSVVVDIDEPTRVGRVCRIVNPGSSYQVRFANANQCMLMPHSALAPAPAGTAGPPCTPDC
jgi:hypothetical protein